MAPPLTTRSFVFFAAVLAAGGCQRMQDRGTETYVSGLRLLTIQANAPEVSAGQTTTLTALAVDTQNRPIDIAWAYCTDASSGGGRLNTDCVTKDQADFLTPFGSGGLSTMFVMPNVDPAVYGDADQTGGVYLPIRAKVTAGTDSVTAIYSLRANVGTPPPTPNQNPVLTGIYQVMQGAGDGSDGGPSDGGSYSSGAELLTPLDPMTPLVVHSGDKLTLRALFTAASAESYSAPGRTTDAGTAMPRKTKERLTLSFFATAGTIGRAVNFGTTDGGTTATTDGGTMGGMGGFMNGGQTPDTVLTLDSNLPASGGTIDLWVVGRDNRGGADYLHRTLTLQ